MGVPTLEDEVERVYALCLEPGEPALLEALWDGDTTGWMLELWLTGSGRILGKNERKLVATLRYGSDIRLISGSVPPWPESLVAQRIGERLATECGCVLWFPSPDTPDDNCPTYAERDRALPCGDCSKLILPQTSPFLPKELCYHCHLERDRKAKLAHGPTDSTRQRGTWFQVEGRAEGKPYFKTWFASGARDSTMRDLLQRLFPELDPEADVELNVTDTATLRGHILTQLEKDLANYEPPASRWRHAPLKTVRWDGTEYVLSLQFSEHHRRISHLLGIAAALGTAQPVLRVFRNTGLKYRDTSILAHIRSSDGTVTRASVVEHWCELLGSPDSVSDSLARLLATKCLEEGASGVLTLTRKGWLVDLSEEGG